MTCDLIKLRFSYTPFPLSANLQRLPFFLSCRSRATDKRGIEQYIPLAPAPITCRSVCFICIEYKPLISDGDLFRIVLLSPTCSIALRFKINFNRQGNQLKLKVPQMGYFFCFEKYPKWGTSMLPFGSILRKSEQNLICLLGGLLRRPPRGDL